MDRQTAQSLVKWAKVESRALTESGDVGPGTPLESWLIETWTAERPDLVSVMKEWGALPQLAHVLAERIVEAKIQYQRDGMSSQEAHQTAVADWAMFDPDATSPQALGDQITA